MSNKYLNLLWESFKINADNPAITDRNGQRTISYRELDETVEKISISLRLVKGRDKSPVPILMDNSAEYIIAELAVWKAGYSYIPLGFTFPKQRINFIKDQNKANILLDKALYDKLNNTKDTQKLNSEDVSMESQAFMIYTSGSTGAPKGIVHTFDSLLYLHRNNSPFNGIQNIVWGASAPFYFIASVWANFEILIEGGHIHLYDEEVRTDVKKMEEYMAKQAITHTFISPSVLGNFTSRSSALKTVFAGSERLSGQCSRDGYQLINAYGLSETLGGILYFPVDRKYDTTPVGKPLSGSTTEYRLVNEDGKEVKKGETGELIVKGVFTDGYANDRVQTDKLFKNGWLHTGDLMYQNENNDFVYVNRKDWMVKVNGQRVEPGEVENAMKGIEGVNDAVVKGFNSTNGSQYLCGFFTGNEALTPEQIKEKLEDKLPHYMVPLHIVRLESFPMLPNGKKDRKSLIPPTLESIKVDYVVPSNETEEKLCRAFGEIFKSDKIGVNDDFFALGGNSINVMKLQTLLRELDLSSTLIYKGKTPKKIAELCGIREINATETAPSQPVPLSQTQAGIYAQCMSRKGKAVYNIPQLYKLDKTVDTNKLAKAIEETVEAHPFIKLRIEEDKDGNPVMITQAYPYQQKVEKKTVDEVKRLSQDLIQPFDLLKDPLFRIRIFETEENPYMFMDFHHIIYDGTSMQIFMKDLNKSFNGEKLTPEDWSGFNVALEEEKMRETDSYSEAKDWYEKHFGALDLDSKPIPDSHGEEVSFDTYNKDLAVSRETIEKYCQKLGVTPNVLMLGVFGKVLGTFINLNESIFATVYNGRNSVKTERTVDMMVKTLPVYCKWNAETKISDYLKAIKELLTGAMNNDIYSFAELASTTDINSDILFTYQGDYLELDQIGGKPYENIELERNSTGNDLNFQLFVKDGRPVLNVEYRSDKYSEGFINEMTECFNSVLVSIIDAEVMSEVNIISKDQENLLDSFNNSDRSYDNTQSVVSLFNNAAKKFPDNKAIIYEDKTYTYRETNEITDKIASYIVGKGLNKEDVVSILIPRSEWMVLASLGALKSGCGYQPLDNTYPKERINFMLKDSSAKLLITTPELRDIADEYSGEILYISEIEKLPTSTVGLREPSPEDLFTLLYTSGSTGVPKGVRVVHSNLVCFINWYQRYYDLKPESRVGAYASYGFDANMMDMYPALTCGACVCIIPEEIRLDMEILNAYIVKNGVTHQFMTTQVGRQFASDVTETTLKYLSMGGEKLISFPVPKEYATFNLYGPTECTIISTAYNLVPAETVVPIGKVVDNMKGYVVDPNGKRVPVGAIGELWLAGPQIARGYLNRPEKTAEVFIDNPFDDGKYLPLYRTGDVVRYMADGNIEFIGRSDGQVKIRGFRIELSEVEAVIRDYPGINDATVAAFDHPSGGKFIAAYVVSDEPVDSTALNAFILERKPPYMVPATTVQIDKIPLTQNHKVNKRALPTPTLKIENESEKEHRTLNPLEIELKKIIGKVLGNEESGVTTPFVNLGLTSILSIKLASQIYKRFGIEVPSKVLLNGASIETVESLIIEYWMNPEVKKENTKEPDERQGGSKPAFIPLSFPQTGVYFECMKKPADVTYNIPARIEFDKKISADTLSEAVKKVLEAHPGIDVHFEMTENGVMQVMNEPNGKAIEVISLGKKEKEDFAKDFVKPFKLNSGPLYRLAIVESEDSTTLFVDFHHLIFDGTSLDILLRQIGDALNGETLNLEGYTYADYVADEKKFEQSPEFEENKDFYASMLSDFENASELSADLKGKENEGQLKTFAVPLDIEKVENYSKKLSVTPAAVMLASTFYTVCRYVNDHNVYLSTISSGRSDVKTGDTFGMFVNTLPLGIKVGEESADAFIKKSAEVFTNVLDHEKYPFANINSDYGFQPQIVYEYQLGVVGNSLSPRIKGVKSLEQNNAKFKLSVHIEEKEGEPSIVVYYNDALYSRGSIEGFTESIRIATEKMMANGSQPIKKVNLIDQERAAKLDKFHTVATAEPKFSYFHEGVEHQAKLHPGRTALIACDGEFTYKELDEYANRIANALIERGVEPRSRVALMLPRTSRMIMSMFGVMKAGSAYIPCDPEYPVERIQHILNDSNAAFIITTSDRLINFPNAIDVETLLKTSPEKPNVNITPKDLAYLIYTSGSTGKPKGVMLRHESIANYLTPHPANRHINALYETSKTLLSITTVSFDMSLKEIGAALFNGLTLVFANEDQTTNPILLAELFKKTNADSFNTTPSRMLQFMELPAFAEALHKCKVLMCGGEKYADGLLDKLREAAPEARIFNTYGPTEITVSSNAKELTHTNKVNIGRPLLNVTEFIADKDGNELPNGIVGELYIGGMGVATGYNDLPEMTAERFIDYKGMRVYKSGDYARWTDKGDVEVLGRTDNQIKLRGLRIELGEVEAALAAVEGIKNVVVKIGKIKGEEHLCAYFTADHKVEIPGLKAELGKTLTKYMVPTAYLQMDKMPLTPNGKTDVKNLPEPQLALSGIYEAPANETEQAIADIFSKILKLDKVGATDSFYEMGGTSLLTTRVIIETDKLGYNVAYGDVFKHPTPRTLANFILGIENEENKDDEATNYDYSAINVLLKGNTLEAFRMGKLRKLGNVLLTGSTGYLGIHILKELIDSEVDKIYCMVRGKNPEDAAERLKTLLFYYFENSYENLIGNRIHLVVGDVTSPIDQSLGIDTVINCAAIVKHFSEGTEIEDVNIGGAQNCVDFCLAKGARLIQISTASTRGLSVNGVPSPGEIFNEQRLYMGQFLGNKYIFSKFIAERLILEAAATQNLDAKIMRVGNLAPRSTDGEFQVNFQTNSFMGRLKVYNMLGCCPYESRDGSVEFSPINEVAKAIVRLSTTPKENVVFHPYNNHFVLLGDVLGELKHIGDGIRFVELDEFSKELDKAKEDPKKAQQLSSMLAYQNMANGQKSSDVLRQNAFTMQVLYRLGYSWSQTSWDYVDRFFNAINGLGFFDK